MEDQAAAARKRMVAAQLRARGISDERVLVAMEKVPRHLFLPEVNIQEAYEDHPVSIGSGQTMSQPYMVALMTECLALKGHEKVLEVGTGSGYQAAILAELAAHVYTVERVESLADRARQRLADTGYTNVDVFVGDGTLGLPAYAPYQGIIVTAGTPKIARAWEEQLAEGCWLVVPVGDRWSQQLVTATKIRGRLERQTVCGCVFVPLIGEDAWPIE
jgi:protein-L-isoaspartate(D-aspartate) O-methyltransferase